VSKETVERGSGTLQDFIAGDIAGFKERSPSLVVESPQPLQLASGRPVELRFLPGDAFGNHEAIAYLVQDTSVAVYVLSCRGEDGFVKSLPAFKEMASKSFVARTVFEK